MDDYVHGVYYPSWAVYSGKPPSSLQVACITHVFYAFVRVNEDGTLKSTDEWADNDKEVDGEKGCLAALAKLRQQNPHIKTLVSIGGGGGSAEFPQLAANITARETFAAVAREFVDAHSMDGVDIDWEHPKNPEQGSNYLALLRALRRVLPSPRYLVTTALPTARYVLRNLDLAEVAETLDFLNLMAYDFTGSWTDVAGHHAQLYCPKGSCEDLAPALRNCAVGGCQFLGNSGFPARKIVLGVPAYARTFAGAQAAGHKFDKAGEMQYRDLPKEWVAGAVVDAHCATASWVDLVRDEGGEVVASADAGAEGGEVIASADAGAEEGEGKGGDKKECGDDVDDGGEGRRGFVSFDVPATVRVKARYVKSNFLAGMFYWTGTGDREGADSLITAGFEELHSHY